MSLQGTSNTKILQKVDVEPGHKPMALTGNGAKPQAWEDKCEVCSACRCTHTKMSYTMNLKRIQKQLTCRTGCFFYLAGVFRNTTLQ